MAGSYIPLPDEPAEEIPQTTMVHYRYRVVHIGEGLIESTSRKAHAMEIAQYHANRLQAPIQVQDAMAHDGAESVWTVEPKAVAQ